MRKFLLAIIVLLTLAICGAFLGIGYFLFVPALAPVAVRTTPAPVVVSNNPSPSTTPTARRTTGAATPPPTRIATTASSPNKSTLDTLYASNPLPNDRVRLGQEYKGLAAALATPVAPKQYKIGDRETFWISRNVATSEREQIQANLRYMNEVAYMWVEEGEQVSDAALKRSADNFAKKIYPTNHKYLGTEASPGIDNDPRLHILNAAIDGASGYYSSPDTLSKSVYPQSNEHEMMYLSTNSLQPGNTVYDSVLAHEFAHMIHDNQNRRGEATWITEGFGELGMELNGYPTGHERTFAENVDLQLTAWGLTPGASIAHYGASYLFFSYQLNRFGIDYIRDVFSTDTTGIQTIEQALATHAPDLHFENIFADWAVANFINDQTQDKRFHYTNDKLNLRPTAGYSQYPAQGSDTVNQFGTDYIQLSPKGKDITFTFDGSDTVRAIPTDAKQGSSVWWSGHTDSSDARLTRAIDLTGVKQATLKFSAWYEIEDNYDYAYVSVSTDNGNHWQTLAGKSTTTTDPNGHNYGSGFNCRSGAGCGDGQGATQWVDEKMDLTPFAGKKILLRFQQITDEAVTLNGIAFDNIEIPEIGFKDDAETIENGWTVEGFARMDNVLPQRFIVQAIEFGGTPRVIPIPLDAQNRGTFTTSGFGKDVSRVVIVISGSTPITYQTADYQYQIQ